MRFFDGTKGISRFLLLVLLFCPLVGWSATRTLYVSPQGSDSWSGTLAAPNAEGSDGPLATLKAACEKVKALNSDQPQPTNVSLRGGLYELGSPWEIGPEESGSPESPITFAAYPGEAPVISGGQRISGWNPTTVNGQEGWVTHLPAVAEGKWWFRELFVKGERLPRTRVPETGVYHFQQPIDASGETSWNHGSLGAVYKGEDIKPWSHLADVEIVGLTRWIETRVPIQSVDTANHTVTFGTRSTFRLENTRPGATDAARYYVENVFEALDKPGEWYLERETGNLYYLPRPGESPETLEAIAPALPQLLRIVGTAEAPVRHLTFDSIAFRYCEWNYPAGDAGSVQAAFEVPAAVHLENASDCAFIRCEVSRVGTYGLEIGAGCDSNQVVRCRFEDLGAGGVKIGHGSERTTLSDCVLRDGGVIHHSGIGVWIGNSGHNTVVHNDIQDFFYTGISVGWTWGYGPSNAVENIIEHNHIHDIGKGLLSDMGGIYTLGISDGTRLRHNLIQDVSSYSYGGWGIYTDEGSSHILIENNLVDHTKTGGFHQHYGKENVVRNNIFAFAVEQQLQRSREEDHKSFDFVNNIVYWNRGVLLGSTWKNDRFTMDNNLYWDTRSSDFPFAGGTFEEWKARGHDQHSLVADPLFRDPEKGDFRLAPGSPAIGLGFESFDVSDVGPRKPLMTRTNAAPMPQPKHATGFPCGCQPSVLLNRLIQALGR